MLNATEGRGRMPVVICGVGDTPYAIPYVLTLTDVEDAAFAHAATYWSAGKDNIYACGLEIIPYSVVFFDEFPSLFPLSKFPEPSDVGIWQLEISPLIVSRSLGTRHF
jgi:hypothetical protein